jgi:hypothetical protein
MTTEALYDDVLRNMDATVQELSRRVPAPRRVPYKDSFVFRHIEKSLSQALVQKLARYLSSLRAARLLLNAGFLQEQAALQRMLDEIQEDIAFLSFSVVFNDTTPLHQAYLDAFFEEEFDADSAMESEQRRPMIPRQKIRAYIARCGGKDSDPSTGLEAARTVSKAYSGYVHAASPQIMDMYGGDPPRFHTSGMKGSPLEEDHRDDLWNYFYRGILAFAYTAKAFGDEEMFASISRFAEQFSRSQGKGYESILRGETKPN